jgi:hypothetical protein
LRASSRKPWQDYAVRFTLFALLGLFARLAAFSLGILTAASAAAAPMTDFMPPEDQALVVFIQNLREDRAMRFVVFEADRRCVAEVGGREARIVPMEPGSRRLYVTGYSTERIELHLQAGRTYFVRLYTEQRPMARKSRVTPVVRGSSSYMELRTWLDGAVVTHASDDPCRGKPVKGRKKRTSHRIVEADADWNDGGETYQAERTLREQDGFTQSELEAMKMPPR